MASLSRRLLPAGVLIVLLVGCGVAVAADGAGAVARSSFLGGHHEDLGSGVAGDAFVARVKGPPAAASSGTGASPARERRIRLYLGATVVLFLGAVLQTLWLRRRPRPDIGPVASAEAATRAEPQWYEPTPPPLSDLPPLRPRPVPATLPTPGRGDGESIPLEMGTSAGDVAVPDLLPDEEEEWAPEQAPETEPATDHDDRVGPGDAVPPVDVLAPDLWGPTDAEPDPDESLAWRELLDERTVAVASEAAPPPSADDEAVAPSAAEDDDWVTTLWGAGDGGEEAAPAPEAGDGGEEAAPAPEAGDGGERSDQGTDVDHERRVIEMGLAGLVAEVGVAAQALDGDRLWPGPRAHRQEEAPPAMPPAAGPLDPATADAPDEELSVTELLSEELRIPHSSRDDDELSIRQLLSEDLPIPGPPTPREPPAADERRSSE